MTERAAFVLFTCASLVSVATPAFAETKGSARERFERGYGLARDGDFEAAIAEFEAAYATSPNFSVLFNLGQAYGAAGHAVEAAHALERYLELGGTAVSDEQREKVTRLIEYYRRRVGKLSLDVAPAGAHATLDGKDVGSAPFAQPLEVTAGTHGLSITLQGYEPANVSVRIEGGQSTPLKLELVAHQAPALLRVACPVSDVQIDIDGKASGSTPLGDALRLRPGKHELTMRREGYVASQKKLDLAPESSRIVDCELRVDAKAPGLSRLRVRHPEGTQVLVDARPFDGNALPQGRHEVTVVGAGYERTAREVRLAPGASITLDTIPTLAPSRLESERSSRQKTQKIVAYALGGAALAAGTSSVILALSNRSRYADWRAKDERFLADYAKSPQSATPQQLDELTTEENSIRNRDTLALGLGVAGSLLLAGSAALYLTAGGGGPALIVTGAHDARLTYRASF